MAYVTVDLTTHAASPCDGTLPECCTIDDDDGDVVLSFDDVDIRMTNLQFTALLEAYAEWHGAAPAPDAGKEP